MFLSMVQSLFLVLLRLTYFESVNGKIPPYVPKLDPPPEPVKSPSTEECVKCVFFVCIYAVVEI